MRSSSRRRSFIEYFGDTPVVRILIFFNIAVFVLGMFVPKIYAYFSLSPDSLKSGKVWTLISYAFLHGGFFHIMCNMLGLYFLGTFVEKWLGAKKFVALFFFGALTGALLWLGFSWSTNSLLVGASAGVMAVLACFCVCSPPVPITFLLFFILPIRLKPLTLLKVATGFEIFGLFYSFSYGQSEIAYAAHLGGIGAGVLFAELARRGKLNFLEKFSIPTPKMFAGRHNKQKASAYKFKIDVPTDISASVDKILQKVEKFGFSSLTDEEREFLRRVNKR